MKLKRSRREGRGWKREEKVERERKRKVKEVDPNAKKAFLNEN